LSPEKQNIVVQNIYLFSIFFVIFEQQKSSYQHSLVFSLTGFFLEKKNFLAF